MEIEKTVQYKKIFAFNSKITENKIFIVAIISLNKFYFKKNNTNIKDKANN